jgi:hypothetical protein
MAKSMLDEITLAEVAGLINDITAKFIGRDGRMWLAAFKRFLRKENPWPENPFQQTVEQQLDHLRKHIGLSEDCEHGAWRITEEDLAQLATSAPAWPKGHDAFRYIKIRWGEADAGVALTAERHMAAIKRELGDDKFWRWPHLYTAPHPYQGKPVERLRLLNGNDTHKPTFEWAVTDLSEHRERESVTAVRNSNSLADGGYAIVWQFRGRAEAINYDDVCAWFLGGYELNVPEGGDESWQNVPCVGRNSRVGGVGVGARWRSDDNSAYSVPGSRESGTRD